MSVSFIQLCRYGLAPWTFDSYQALKNRVKACHGMTTLPLTRFAIATIEAQLHDLASSSIWPGTIPGSAVAKP